MKRAIALLVSVCAFSSTASALNRALDIHQYAHTAWKTREGFGNGSINALAQTPDGYLWLGTDFGLLRFDGVKVVPWHPPEGQPLPSNHILSLLVATDGTLWIGTTSGVAAWKRGALAVFPQLSGSYVMFLVQAHDGAIWLSGRQPAKDKLCAIRAGRVSCEEDARLPAALGLFEDHRGVLWVGVPNGLWRWKPGPPVLYQLPGNPDGIQAFADDDDGTLLIGTRDGLKRFKQGKVEPYTPVATERGITPFRILRDRDRALWIASQEGLMHVHQGRADVFGESEGLSAQRGLAMLEDREGSVWVATNDGLDRFREYVIPTVSGDAAHSSTIVEAVLATRAGNVWLNGSNRLRKWSLGSLTNVDAPGLASDPVESLLEDHRGRLVVAVLGGVGYFEDGRFGLIAGVPGGHVPALAEDTFGNVWIANQEHGLFRVGPNGALEHVQLDLPSNAGYVTALIADPTDGSLWLGFPLGGVSHFANGRVLASYTDSDGLAPGGIRSFRFDAKGTLWISTDGGLSRLRDGRLTTLSGKNGLPCDGVHWTIEDDANAMWLYTPCGLLRLARAEMESWIGDPRGPVRPVTFDQSDGVPVSSLPISYSPIVTKAADGRIWFASLIGAGVINPRELAFNSLPPPVYIEQIFADHKPRATGHEDAPVLLPALTRELQVDYTALSLVAPEKVRFRYMLEGRDREWQDVGTRRQAFYDSLPPRTYRFRVIASNNSGVWNETGAALEFVIPPAYYQTTWFLVLCGGMVLTLAWVAHRVRLNMVETHEREISALNERLMKAQEQERIRIAGELHDGVMQELLSAAMMLGTAKRRIADDSEAKGAKGVIDKVQEKLVQAGTDIRQLSHELHPPMLQQAGLPDAVRSYCDQFSASSGIPVACEADESVRDLSRGAALAIFRIVQEALGNAAKHASPRHLAVRLTRGNGMVSLIVSDDGVGFDGSKLNASRGLGLITMRERASQLNGTFDFETAPDRGMTITVTVPFR